MTMQHFGNGYYLFSKNDIDCELCDHSLCNFIHDSLSALYPSIVAKKILDYYTML